MSGACAATGLGHGELAAKRCWLLDGDGVLYLGSGQDRRPLPGAAELIGLLRRRGCCLALVTNSSAATPVRIAEDLGRIGIAIDPAEIATSAAAAVIATMPIRTAMVLGGDGIVDALALAGVEIVQTAPSSASLGIDAVFVGMDRALSYQRLSAAVLAIQHGARFIATNPDPAFPTEQGLVPGAGSIVAAISAVVGRGPDLIAGKPEPRLLLDALARNDARKSDAIMLGDQLETDILAGARAGIDTLLLRTGIAGRSSDVELLRFRERHRAPTYVADDLTAVLRSLQRDTRSLL
jgi:4-nitrophenyl phosphatase